MKLCCELFQKFVTEISVLEMTKQASGNCNDVLSEKNRCCQSIVSPVHLYQQACKSLEEAEIWRSKVSRKSLWTKDTLPLLLSSSQRQCEFCIDGCVVGLGKIRKIEKSHSDELMNLVFLPGSGHCDEIGESDDFGKSGDSVRSDDSGKSGDSGHT